MFSEWIESDSLISLQSGRSCFFRDVSTPPAALFIKSAAFFIFVPFFPLSPFFHSLFTVPHLLFFYFNGASMASSTLPTYSTFTANTTTTGTKPALHVKQHSDYFTSAMSASDTGLATHGSSPQQQHYKDSKAMTRECLLFPTYAYRNPQGKNTIGKENLINGMICNDHSLLYTP